MKSFLTALLLGVVAMAGSLEAADKVPPALNFKMKSLAGKEVNLAQYHGQVVLIVNTASECGLTPQYEGLQKLHEKYAPQGLAILGFPCNQFGAQEPGSAQQIAAFCTENYGVTFDMFEKIDVNGAGQAPLYKYLTSKETNPRFAGPISWNFGKFLLDRQGNVVARFEPRQDPESPEVVQAIEEQLKRSK